MTLSETVAAAGQDITGPTYVYDLAALRAKLRRVEAIPWARKRIFFATMANDHPAILTEVRLSGHGVFVNSPKHLRLALNLGFPAASVIYAASNMTEQEMAECIDKDIHVVLDSLGQVEMFAALAAPDAAIGIRLNVGSALGGGALRDDPEYRFGLLPAELPAALAAAADKGIRITGVHSYFGTDLMDPAVLLEGLERLGKAAAGLPHLAYIDGGGGFGIADELDAPEFDLDRYGAGAAEIMGEHERRTGRPLSLFIEPGRYLAARCGWFFARAIGHKARQDRLMVGLGASVAQLPRMLLHPTTARHPWRILGREAAAPDARPVWLCGNSTYSRDFLARDCTAPVPAPGEIVVFHNAGAYCRSMLTDFLGKERPAEIVLDSESRSAAAPDPAEIRDTAGGREQPGGAMGMYNMLRTLEPARQQLWQHEIYSAIDDPQSLRLFMQHHVFAVWDFMSLLKALQRSITCVELPWLPPADPIAGRLINAIVLEEESDDCGELGYLSHFQLYRLAMAEVGADCSTIDAFTALIAEGVGIEAALERARAPVTAQAFVRNTFQLLATGEPHLAAAAFAFGREDPIPGMFRRLLAPLEERSAGTARLLRFYLDRHIGLDEDHHTPLAVQMLASLCGEDRVKWQQALDVARAALAARLDLWSGVTSEIALLRSGVGLGLAA